MGSLREQYEEMKQRAELTEPERDEEPEKESEASGSFEKSGTGMADLNEADTGRSEAHGAEADTESGESTFAAARIMTEQENNASEGTERGLAEKSVSEYESKETDENKAGTASEKEAQSSAMLRRGLRFSYGIRLIAALYLFYISFKMYQTRDLNTGMNQAVSYGFMIFFVLVGIFLLVNSIRGSKKLNDEQKKK